VKRIAGLLVVLLAACSTGGDASTSGTDPNGKITVVAAENFWGSLVQQLGGDRVQVTEIIDNPDADPHDYEPTPDDARRMATARYVILNGLGYDAWADDLLDANPSESRTVLDIGDLLGLKTGDNPHRWYFPDDVTRVVDRITSDLKSLDPTHASYYDQQHDLFTSTTLKPYRDLIADIRSKYANTPVGASESIATGLVEATGLDLKTPVSFLDATSEGNDPDAADKVTVDAQIADREISAFIYNTQNATPDVQRLVDAANDNGIPVVPVTETPIPAHARFQDWQTNQLQHLADALAQAKR
jgi:zinc/manganese transport system substrate-binding protein